MGDNLYTAMYGNEDDEEPSNKVTVPKDDNKDVIFSASRHVVSVRSGEESVNLPSLPYVRELEQTVIRLTRDIRRMMAQTRQLSTAIRQMSSEHDGLRNEIGQKIDRRD